MSIEPHSFRLNWEFVARAINISPLCGDDSCEVPSNVSFRVSPCGRRRGEVRALNSASLCFSITKTIRVVVVDHSDGLHERITNRRTDKLEAAGLQIAAERV
jgi:hypothetical protein